jgi:hypothetical protein
MAQALTEFVKQHVEGAKPAIRFDRQENPQGFDSVLITDGKQEWWSGECGGFEVAEIYSQLAERIREKEKRLPTYTANLGNGARVWLLLHSGVTVARSMCIPFGIEGWIFPHQFERVFWFTALDGKFTEIRKA